MPQAVDAANNSFGVTVTGAVPARNAMVGVSQEGGAVTMGATPEQVTNKLLHHWVVMTPRLGAPVTLFSSVPVRRTWTANQCAVYNCNCQSATAWRSARPAEFNTNRLRIRLVGRSLPQRRRWWYSYRRRHRRTGNDPRDAANSQRILLLPGKHIPIGLFSSPVAAPATSANTTIATGL